ncbi:biotin synthase BioB [Desulfovibrio sp. OttesenSCG-928-A18]|nr:biotin synthase BioB [Desulfovibrio sp. OttesenSCG-928-A18]
MHQILADILRNIPSPLPLSQQDALGLVQLHERHLPDIMALARLHTAQGGREAFSCGIINARSGRCSEDCAFCAQSARHKAGVREYALLPEETLLQRALDLTEAGLDYFGIVTSGARPSGRDLERICRAAERITRETPIRLCASLGIISNKEATALKQAGFTSYHHNLECARSFFSSVCGTHSFEERAECVAEVRKAGLRVCSGGIFGLGESWRQRLELAATLAELRVDSVPVNFLTPIAGTPLEKAPGLTTREALALVAILRLMLPEQDIVICGGRGRTLGEWDNAVFFAGANGIMVGDYLTTSGGMLERDLGMLRLLGLR